MSTALEPSISFVRGKVPTELLHRQVIFIGFGDIVRSRGARAYLTSFLGALKRHGVRLDATFYQQDVAGSEPLINSAFLPTITVPPCPRWLRYFPGAARRLWETCWSLWQAAGRLRVALTNDAVILVTGPLLLILTPLLRRRSRYCFYLMHGIAEEFLMVPSRRARVRYRMAKFLERISLRHFSAVVVVSDAMARYCRQEYGVERFVLVPCGVDLALFREAASLRQRIRTELGVEGRRVLLYSGSADPSHCVTEVVKAYAVARQIIPDAFLLILSHEPSAFKALLSQSGETDWKVLSLSPEDVPAYLSAGDAAFLLLPNRLGIWVSCPVKFAEYMASGLPVIAAPYVGDCSMVVRNEAVGVLMDPNDQGTWAPALAELSAMLGDRTVRARCLKVAESLSWDKLPSRFETRDRLSSSPVQNGSS